MQNDMQNTMQNIQNNMQNVQNNHDMQILCRICRIICKQYAEYICRIQDMQNDMQNMQKVWNKYAEYAK